jgi:hypothetical protein
MIIHTSLTLSTPVMRPGTTTEAEEFLPDFTSLCIMHCRNCPGSQPSITPLWLDMEALKLEAQKL